MLAQELLRHPYETRVGVGGVLTGVQKFPEGHRFAGQVKGSVERTLDSHGKEARDILDIDEFDRIVAVSGRDVFATYLRAQQPGEQVGRVVAAAFDRSGPHDREAFPDDTVKPPLALSLVAIVEAAGAVP